MDTNKKNEEPSFILRGGLGKGNKINLPKNQPAISESVVFIGIDYGDPMGDRAIMFDYDARTGEIKNVVSAINLGDETEGEPCL